jgi:RNA polymerase sigma factor (sigma-70 family)
VADILQDIYIEILKDQCASLQRFRGKSELEARAYLVRLATNITFNHLRRTSALKRNAPTDQIDELFQDDEEIGQNLHSPGDYTDALAERELIDLLRRIHTGEHARRDIMLYLLHVREGMTTEELAASGICHLKPSSISQIIRQIRAKLKKIY